MKTAHAMAIVKAAWEAGGACHPARDGRALFMFKRAEGRRYHLAFSFTERFDGLGVNFGCSFVPDALGDAVDFIDQQPHRVFPKKSREWQFFQVHGSELQGLAGRMMDEAESWIRVAEFDSYLAWLASTLDVPGSHQLWHLAALASVGDQETLRNYLSRISDAGRGGLFPYIASELVERALVHAQEVGTSVAVRAQ